MNRWISRKQISPICFMPVFVWLILYSTQPQIVKKIDCNLLAKIDETLFPFVTETISSTRPNKILDILAAIVYTTHFTIPFLFTAYLFFKHGMYSVNRFAWYFGMINTIAVIIQILHPTAPPWYTDICSAAVDHDHGETMKITKGNAAGLKRVDNMLHVPFFTIIYAQSKVVFGAFPSLHASWPLLISVIKPEGLGLFPWGVIHSLWVAWAALYLSHHYFIDAIGGWILVILVITDWKKLLLPLVLRRKPRSNNSSSGRGTKGEKDFIATIV